MAEERPVEQIRSADKVLSMVIEDTTIQDAIKNDPIQGIAKVVEKAKQQTAQPIYTRDKTIYRMVVVFLGGVAAVAAIGAIILVAMGKTTPDVLVALGSAGIGALAGLLAPSPAGK